MNSEKEEVTSFVSQERVSLWGIGVLWGIPVALLVFGVGLIEYYWERLLYVVLVGLAVVASSAIAYYVTLIGLGRARPWPKFRSKLLAAYAIAACLIVLLFQGMASLQIRMNQAGEMGDMDTVLQLNLIYAGLGVMAGILLHVHGWIKLCRGKIDLNGWIIPAFFLLFVAPIYKMLYVTILVKYGFISSGILGFVSKLLSMQDLQLAFLLLAGVVLVKGLTKH